MATIIKLKESQITNIVRRILREEIDPPVIPDGNPPPHYPQKRRSDTLNLTIDEVQEVFQARTVEDVYEKYEGLYNNTKPEDRVGAISPEEFRIKGKAALGDPYTDPTDGDPQANILILLGMLLFAGLVYFASHVWPWQCC